jgi:hypothetical protein
VTGEDLYKLWADNALDNGLEVDAWEDLDELFQSIWNDTAIDLMNGALKP